MRTRTYDDSKTIGIILDKLTKTTSTTKKVVFEDESGYGYSKYRNSTTTILTDSKELKVGYFPEDIIIKLIPTEELMSSLDTLIINSRSIRWLVNRVNGFPYRTHNIVLAGDQILHEDNYSKWTIFQFKDQSSSIEAWNKYFKAPIYGYIPKDK